MRLYPLFFAFTSFFLSRLFYFASFLFRIFFISHLFSFKIFFLSRLFSFGSFFFRVFFLSHLNFIHFFLFVAFFYFWVFLQISERISAHYWLLSFPFWQSYFIKLFDGGLQCIFIPTFFLISPVICLFFMLYFLPRQKQNL